jgi:hypothetical protein
MLDIFGLLGRAAYLPAVQDSPCADRLSVERILGRPAQAEVKRW